MMGLTSLVKRNTKLYFKDKGMFFTSLITPLILLVLYITFLGNVYRDSFSSALPPSFQISENLINATVGGELVSSLLAVCCVTVAFCSNLLMISDRVNGAAKDLAITPVRPSAVALGYFISTVLSTLAICMTALGASFIYLSHMGWYLSASDVLLLILDVILLVLFGTALCRDVSAHDLRSGLGGRNRSQRGIRLHMRSIYADLKLRIRTSARNFVPSRNVRHFPSPKSYAPRSV